MKRQLIASLKRKTAFMILFIVCLLVWIPLWMVITGSFMGVNELENSIGSVITDTNDMANWHILPEYPTLRPYVELLLDSPEFFVMFWNSVKQVFPVLIGQIIVAVPAAWGFSKFNFRFKKILFSLYITLMLMPFQITMVSSYIVLDELDLMNTHYAVILPSLFSTFPIFIMVKFFSAIPKSLMEAAALDGASEWQIFIKIGVPLGAPGIISAMILGFLEYWNAIEQPLTFLQDKELWPLALYLPNIAVDEAGVSMVASVIMMIPALLIFLYGQKYLEQGIRASGLKE